MKRKECMVGYLVYHPKEAEKNQAFIQFFEKEGAKQNMIFRYVSHEEYTKETLPDFVLNRTRDTKVSRWYEQKKIPVFHSALITGLGNHKMKTLEFFRERLSDDVLSRKWAPKTCFLPKERLKAWVELLEQWDCTGGKLFCEQELEKEVFSERLLLFQGTEELVLKSVDGHGGAEVALLPGSVPELQMLFETDSGKLHEELKVTLARFAKWDCILQERIPSDSRDVRVYILGNKIYQAVCRQGKNDFRSNFSLGGNAAPYELSPRQRKYVEAFLEACKEETLGLVGIDFILDTKGNLVFNELEEMVGCRMLYQQTECDVVKDYVLWLKKIVENNGCQQVV